MLVVKVNPLEIIERELEGPREALRTQSEILGRLAQNLEDEFTAEDHRDWSEHEKYSWFANQVIPDDFQGDPEQIWLEVKEYESPHVVNVNVPFWEGKKYQMLVDAKNGAQAVESIDEFLEFAREGPLDSGTYGSDLARRYNPNHLDTEIEVDAGKMVRNGIKPSELQDRNRINTSLDLLALLRKEDVKSSQINYPHLTNDFQDFTFPVIEALGSVKTLRNRVEDGYEEFRNNRSGHQSVQDGWAEEIEDLGVWDSVDTERYFWTEGQWERARDLHGEVPPIWLLEHGDEVDVPLKYDIDFEDTSGEMDIMLYNEGHDNVLGYLEVKPDPEKNDRAVQQTDNFLKRWGGCDGIVVAESAENSKIPESGVYLDVDSAFGAVVNTYPEASELHPAVFTPEKVTGVMADEGVQELRIDPEYARTL